MTNQKYKLIVSDAAFMMLDAHTDFLARVSQNTARNTKDEIIADMKSLRENPQRFPVYESQFITDAHYRKMLSVKRYLVLYEVTVDTVYVDYIVDCREDYERLLK